MKTVKKKSQAQEKSVAKEFNAKTVVASGALWGAKGDVRSDKLLIECKTTSKPYFNLTAKLWEKIEKEATRDRLRIPIMIIDIEDSHRLVVFNPKSFEKDLPVPYDCTYERDKDHKKSRRISLKELEDIERFFGDGHVYGKLFIISGTKNSMLFYMRADEFIEHYSDEIF